MKIKNTLTTMRMAQCMRTFVDFKSRIREIKTGDGQLCGILKES